MRFRISVFLAVLIFSLFNSYVSSQEVVIKPGQLHKVLDSLSGQGFIYREKRENPELRISNEQALSFLRNMYSTNNWKNPSDPLRQAISQLLFFAYGNPFDSTQFFLQKYTWDSINIPWDKFYVWDSLRLKIPVVSPPVFKVNSDTNISNDTLVNRNLIDSARSYETYKISGQPSGNNPPFVSLKDTIILVATDTLERVTGSSKDFPFRYYKWPFESDSIRAAINAVINFIESKDSSIVNLTGTRNVQLPIMVNSKSEKLVRFWLRNEYSDSVAVWVGGVSKNTIGLFLEEGIMFRRPTKQSNISDVKLNLKEINTRNLQEIRQIFPKTSNWRFRSESAFILNQASLTNWVRGGESSISTAMDLTGYADYVNKPRKISSNNYIRLKMGFLKSGDEKIKKNIDLIESNSKLNHKAFGKFDFSAIMLFKTQIAKGWIYPTDSTRTLVSKFMNPATLTIGFGLDYKPNKTTSINFSPLSYKATFMTDTTIGRSKYGIPKGKKSLQEPGASLQITNETRLYKFITLTNRIQLFTNYIHNPQNIDIDWELIASAKINWFTDVRLNTELVFDDDTKTPVFDRNKNPVLVDGRQKQSARIQFKELLGFTFVFRF